MVKTYYVTDKGSGLLQKQKGLAGQLNAWSQAVLAFDPSRKGYAYAPDDPEGAKDQQHLPDELVGKKWWRGRK